MNTDANAHNFTHGAPINNPYKASSSPLTLDYMRQIAPSIFAACCEHFDAVDELNDTEIDDLCERINMPPKRS